MSNVGYARVSTGDQTTDLQTDALSAAGCSKVFAETMSGMTTSRPQLDAALAYLREGDTMVVWRLDRLGRSLGHLIQVIESLAERGIAFRSLTEGIDTSTSTGRLVFSIFGALAEFERALIRERTEAGLAAARARGRMGGRPTVMTPARARSAQRLLAQGVPVTEVAEALGVGRASVYRWLSSRPGEPS